MTFYDRNGNAMVYLKNGEDFYLFNGTPIAFIEEKAIYAFNGRHIGWCDEGWIRDLNGDCVMFAEPHYGGPVAPVTYVEPIKGIEGVQPIKSVPQVPYIRSVDSFNWSRLSISQFFNQ